MNLSAELIEYRDSFKATLAPIFDLFDYKKTTLHPEKWMEFIVSTKARIISNPEQFLGKVLPSESVVKEIVQEIIEEYIEQEVVEA